MSTADDFDIETPDYFPNVPPYEIEYKLLSDPTLQNVPGEIELDKDGRLFYRYLTYGFKFAGDIVSIMNRSYDKMGELIKLTKFLPGSKYIGTENKLRVIQVEFIPRFAKDQSTGNIITITPLIAMEQELTYESIIRLTFELEENNILYTFTEDLEYIPIMLGSKHDIFIKGNMSSEERFAYGSCPDDPVGYFIIDGAEYTFTSRDKLRVNKELIYFHDFLSNTITCETFKGDTTVVKISIDTNKIYRINLKFLGKSDQKKLNRTINVLQIYRILYNTTISAIDILNEYIFPYINPIHRNRVFIELHNTIVDYDTIGNLEEDRKIILDVAKKTELKKVDPERAKLYIYNSIIEDLFPQYDKSSEVNENDYILRKMYHLGIMIGNLAQVSLGIKIQHNRDSYSNKKVDTVGMAMFKLFKDIWRDYSNAINEGIRNPTKSIKDIVSSVFIKHNYMKSFVNSFKNSWGHSKHATKKLTEILKRDSKPSAYAAINKITNDISKNGKVIDPRKPRLDQIGYIDFNDTPEGKDGCGVVKNKAVTAWISTERYDDTIVDIFKQYMPVYPDGNRQVLRPIDNYQTVVIYNGRLMGVCAKDSLYKRLLDDRRSGYIDKDIMLLYLEKNNILYIYADAGRLTRPLLIVNTLTGKLMIEEKNLWDAKIETLISEGCIEYIDIWEQEYIYIAKSIKDIEFKQKNIQSIRDDINNLKQVIEEFEIRNEIFRSVINGNLINKEKYVKEIDEQIELNEQKKEQIYKLIEIDKNRIVEEINKYNLIIEIENYSSELEQFKNIEFKDDIFTENFLELSDELFLLISRLDGTNENKFHLLKNIISVQNYSFNIKLDLVDLNKQISINIKKYNTDIDNIDKKIKSLKLSKDKSDPTVKDFENQKAQLEDTMADMIKSSKYTHCEIHPASLFSSSGIIIPWAPHNPSPRVNIQCGMARQALGIYHSNHKYLFNTTSKMLAHPSRSFVETVAHRVTGIDKNVSGDTLILMIAAYMGFNQEDSIILNRASLQRGLMTINVYKSIDHKYDDIHAKLTKNVLEKLGKLETAREDEILKYRHLDDNGIARPESLIKTGDCLIGIVRETPDGKYEDISYYAKEYHNFYVDRIIHRSTVKKIKIKLRQHRIPITADKFASRIAQKSTVGLILNPEDMPFTSLGIQPDAILNPHAFPSRMTISHLMEMLVTKGAALTGTRVNATSFENINIDQFRDILREYGFNDWGYETVYNGMTGKMIEAQLFTGLIYYQALRHHVRDKIQMRQIGPLDIKTRGPVGGRDRGGAIKFGEMERDVLISHGASELLEDTHCYSSDAFQCTVCRHCGELGQIRFTEGKFECLLCGSRKEIGVCTVPYSAINITSYALQIGTRTKIEFKE